MCKYPTSLYTYCTHRLFNTPSYCELKTLGLCEPETKETLHSAFCPSCERWSRLAPNSSENMERWQLAREMSAQLAGTTAKGKEKAKLPAEQERHKIDYADFNSDWERKDLEAPEWKWPIYSAAERKIADPIPPHHSGVNAGANTAVKEHWN